MAFGKSLNPCENACHYSFVVIVHQNYAASLVAIRVTTPSGSELHWSSSSEIPYIFFIFSWSEIVLRAVKDTCSPFINLPTSEIWRVNNHSIIGRINSMHTLILKSQQFAPKLSNLPLFWFSNVGKEISYGREGGSSSTTVLDPFQWLPIIKTDVAVKTLISSKMWQNFPN